VFFESWCTADDTEEIAWYGYVCLSCINNGKVLPYSLPSAGRETDPGVQAVRLQVTLCLRGSRLPLLSTKPALTFPAKEHHCPSTSTKFSHTRYRVLGPRLIPVYRQSDCRWLYISPAVGCHYFTPSLHSPSQPKNITVLGPVPSYTAWWQRHIFYLK